MFTHESKKHCIGAMIVMLFCMGFNVFFIIYSTVIRELSVGF
jgi:hypothetical protein